MNYLGKLLGGGLSYTNVVCSLGWQRTWGLDFQIQSTKKETRTEFLLYPNPMNPIFMIIEVVILGELVQNWGTANLVLI